MKIKSVVTAATSIVLFFSLAIPTFAQTDKKGDYIISNEAVDFLKDHKVDVTPFKKSNTTSDKIYSKENQSVSISKSDLYDANILSLKQQVAAYNFSDDQIQKYVKGLVDTPSTIINNSGANTYSIASTPYSTNRPGDNGIGYEVVSDSSGYNTSTAFATLPYVNRAGGSSGYLFYTVSGSDGWGIDVGLWYGGGYEGNGWRGVYNSPDLGQHATTSAISGLTAGSRVYFIANVLNNGYLEFKALDANNFNTVYTDFIYYVGNHIWSTNGIFNRQITLCNDTANFSNGDYLNNAKFSDAYLYSTTGYARVTSANTVRHGAFGTNDTNRTQVTVNSYTMWDSEDVSITF
ncbi:hypothetical protein J2Z22_000905 [Paenibacillus forsythiae]|uniref:Uncharacterized protein n=1 Tax=Paenibacillus forsythiae TaxID=365616 RepID=A0ABU3H3J3_9BACL|nr:hypothetical protein [Paenibacillus forsythiae]MDT3425389.1 hypothetical protein [Paenibacillus forsythiae]